MEAIPWTGEKQCRAKKRPPDIPEMFSPGKNIRFNFRPLACGANSCSLQFVQRTLWREKLPNVTFLTVIYWFLKTNKLIFTNLWKYVNEKLFDSFALLIF